MSFQGEVQPGVLPPPAGSSGTRLNHSMLRVKNPQASLRFYTGTLGMRLLRKLDFPEMKFSLYFLGYVEEGEQIPRDDGERTAWTFSRQGVLELTHNWGTETQDGAVYHNGNGEPRGFGHICVSVTDLKATVERLDAHGVKFVKRPEAGSMKDIAFIEDPDGYWIEVVEPGKLTGLGGRSAA